MSNDGKWAENKVRPVLDNLKKKGPYFYLRLYDTTSASSNNSVNFIPEQPGDFILNFKGVSLLIEVKSSEKHESLRSNLSGLVGTGQAANHRLWNRAGHPSVFIFFDLQGSMVEIWDGLLVAQHRAEGKPLPKLGYIKCPLSSFSTIFTEHIKVLNNHYNRGNHES